MSPFRSAWLVLLLLLSMRGVDASVDVQAGNSTISGQVVAASGGALGRARVYLVGESPEPVAPTLTDPNGAFAFSSVPPGMYWIRAELEGWLPAYLGQSGFADSVQAIALGPGSTYAGAKVSMLRLAVITGRVLNQFSQPVERADVNAFGEDLLITHTNDLGEFRIPRVLPGNYLVWAIPPFKGDAADASGPAFAGGNPEHRVSVDFGGEVPTGDIITFPASTGTLTGSITLSDGRPAAGASVSLNIEHLGQRASLSLGRASTVTSAQGEFELKNVAEGAYRLLTSLNFQRGYLDIILRPGDNTVRVSLHRPLSIAGRLNLESPEGSCATPEVVISRIDASSSEDRLPRTTAVLADGTFRFDGVTGTQLVQLRCSGFSYGTVRRIELNGQPIAGDVLEAAKLSGQVAMMLAANAPRNGISGEAVDRAGNRVPGLAVVAVDDPTKWRHPLKFMWTSRIRDGEFRLTGLPPGKYFVFHEPVRRVGELESPEYLRAVRSRGVSVVVRETGIVTVSLKTK